MAQVTLSTDNPRSLKALLLTSRFDHWRPLDDGAYAIPSQRHDGAFYVADADSCSCPDTRYNGGQSCKHQLAVQLRQILEAAALVDLEQPRLQVVA